MNRLEEKIQVAYDEMGDDFKTLEDFKRALSALESQGLKIVPVEESAKMAGAGYVAIRPYMERGKRVKAARAVYAAMLNAVEG